MASKAERLRKAYEFKLGADLAAKLTDSQLKILSVYYNSLDESEQNDIDNKIAMGMSNDLTDMARSMAEENEEPERPEESPPEGPPEDEVEPDGPSGAITLYEGVRETDLVDEDIDETILRALGLEDVFDIDYGTYRTLLKERMMADRMGQTMDSAEAEAITEEFKRIKGKVGRFRIKKQKVDTGNIATPKGGANAGMKNFLALKGDTQEAPAQAEPTEKFTKTNSILDEILSTIQNLFKFEQNRDAKNQRDADRRRKQGREDKLESGSGIGKGLRKAAAAILKPIQGPLEYLINFLKYTFLTYIVKNLFKWFQNPDNQKKLESIGRFLKDWWPVLVGAYLLFGNSISRGIFKLAGLLIKGTAKLLKVAIPSLMKLVRRNPKAAAAAALFTAGATVPMLFPNTVDEQERKITEKPGSNEDKIKKLKEQKANLNPLQQIQGVGTEIDEQIFKLETGETKSYNEGGAVEEEEKKDSKELDMSKFLPFLGPLGLPFLVSSKGKDAIEGIVDSVEKDPKMLLALGPMAFPVMAMLEQRKKKQSTASNQEKKDPARDITTESGTDVTGAGPDTQLVPAKPGEIVINKETVDAVGSETFDKISTNSGEKIMGAGPDTQMIAARPGEVIINRETVNRVGAGPLLGLNKKYGGSNANKPKTAKVQTAMGGGFVLPTFQGGGMVGGPSMVEVPSFVDRPASDYDEGEETPNVRIPSPGGEEEKKEQEIVSAGGEGGPVAPGSTAPTADGLESLSVEQLTQKLDPTITGASNPAVFKAARAAREEAKAAGLPKEEIEKKVLIATIRAKTSPQISGNNKPTPAVVTSSSSPKVGATSSMMPLGNFSLSGSSVAGRPPTQGKPPAGPSEKKGGFFGMIKSVVSAVMPQAAPVVNMIGGLGNTISKAFGGGAVKENSGMDIPGATADRQHIDAQPGEYVLPQQTVGALGGPSAVDKLVAKTDSNSTPAKLAPASMKKPVPGPPVPEGTASMQALPAITGGSTGGGGRQGSSTERQVPTFSATSPYTGDRQNNADIYGIR